MRTRLHLCAALVFLASCATPQIVPAPPVRMSAPTLSHTPVLRPCALLHQRYATDTATAVDGGAPGTTNMIFASVLVYHPTYGPIVIDPAVGREKAKDFAANPWILRRQIGDGSGAVALEDLLAQVHVLPDRVHWALITHMHFDHIGGATDIPNAKILVNAPDLSFADTAHKLWMRVTPQHEIDRIRDRIQTYAFTGPPYDGFPSSFDLFGDGSLVAVPTPGHTPGSVSWFVNSGDGSRWLFVGDAAWLKQGVDRPAHKGWQGRLLDDNAQQAGETLALLHAYEEARPNVHVLTAHDPEMLSVLPPCGGW